MQDKATGSVATVSAAAASLAASTWQRRRRSPQTASGLARRGEAGRYETSGGVDTKFGTAVEPRSGAVRTSGPKLRADPRKKGSRRKPPRTRPDEIFEILPSSPADVPSLTTSARCHLRVSWEPRRYQDWGLS